MLAWRPACVLRLRASKVHLQHLCRRYSTQNVERVEISCASAGSITVDLHNLSSHTATSPLLVYLPPSPYTDANHLPSFLNRYPVVKINYRWSSVSLGPKHSLTSTPTSSSNFTWPTAIHDTLFGYSWVLSNLRPPNDVRRDIYVYGSSLGASLAASLALTECHSRQAMAVRGLAVHNGIYNWTSFLQQHLAPERGLTEPLSDAGDAMQKPHEDGLSLAELGNQTQRLFASPADMLDPFASPVHFFRTAGIAVPEDFEDLASTSDQDTSASSVITRSMAAAIDELSGTPSSPSIEQPSKVPRKGYLAFPPRKSDLRIPSTLLLYDSDPPPTPTGPDSSTSPILKKGGKPKKPKANGKEGDVNTFRTQAAQLATLMRRSVEKIEAKAADAEERHSDEEWDEEAARRRVMVAEIPRQKVGGVTGHQEHETIAGYWLEEVIQGR